MHPLCNYEKQHQFNVLIQSYDATCCPLCNEWIEEQCSMVDCEFCSNRPAIPLSNFEHELATNLILNYAKKGLIPPEEQDYDSWDDLYDKLENLIMYK